LARVVTDRKTPLNRLFDPFDNLIYYADRTTHLQPADELEDLHAAHAGDAQGIVGSGLSSITAAYAKSPVLASGLVVRFPQFFA
jgi:hypothetical protein